MRPALAVVVFALTCLPGRAGHAQRLEFDPEKTYKVDAPFAPTLGSPDALVTIVEFSDFYCGFCRRANQTLRQLMHIYPGELRLQYVHAPLDPQDGTLAAEAALAAHAQGQFWPMHDRIFAGPAAADRALLERYAHELGLDLLRFRADMEGHAHRGELDRNIALASSLGVSATPIFFINGKPVVGARDLGTFVRAVETELLRARRALAAGADRATLYEAIVGDGETRATAEPVEDLPVRVGAGERYPVGLGLPGHQQGPDDALLTLVMVSDFECPFCRKAMPTVEALQSRYRGDLRLVYRHLPLAGHDDALLAAEAAAEAAAQGAFFPYYQRLLANQDDLGRGALEAHATALGLDMLRFRRALDRRSHMQLVLTDAAASAAFGVTGTPTFFVNGVAIIGARPLADFQKLMDIELELARKLVKAGLPAAQVYEAVTSGGAAP